MDNNRGLLWFFAGCAAGTAAALLVTSKSGREAIDSLRQKADDKARTARRSVDDLSEAVTTAATRGIKAVKHETENVAAALDAGRQAYRAAKEMTP